jgi:hypothetical protein
VGRSAPSACSNSRCLRRFTSVDHTTPPWPPEPPGAGCNSFRSRFRCRPSGRGGFVPRASHPAVTSDARLGRVRLAEQPVVSLFQVQQLHEQPRVARCAGWAANPFCRKHIRPSGPLPHQPPAGPSAPRRTEDPLSLRPLNSSGDSGGAYPPPAGFSPPGVSSDAPTSRRPARPQRLLHRPLPHQPPPARRASPRMERRTSGRPAPQPAHPSRNAHYPHSHPLPSRHRPGNRAPRPNRPRAPFRPTPGMTTPPRPAGRRRPRKTPLPERTSPSPPTPGQECPIPRHQPAGMATNFSPLPPAGDAEMTLPAMPSMCWRPNDQRLSRRPTEGRPVGSSYGRWGGRPPHRRFRTGRESFTSSGSSVHEPLSQAHH